MKKKLTKLLSFISNSFNNTFNKRSESGCIMKGNKIAEGVCRWSIEGDTREREVVIHKTKS